jgi:hypothetical protein
VLADLPGTGTGVYVSNLTGLTAGTTYYLRAYATNSVNTTYGNEVVFTTQTIPTVSTDAITNLSLTSATSGGNVTADGGSAVTARGVCWSTTTGPTTANSILADAPGTGIGAFVSNLTGLTGGVTYYLKAYATNSYGTAYGSEVSFTTQVVSLPVLTIDPITSPTAIGGTTGGNITSDGGSPVTTRGVCWSTTPSAVIDLVTFNYTVDITGGTGAFVSTIYGLTTGVTYYIRAYATNGNGTGYSTNEITYMPVAAPTVTTQPVAYPIVSTTTSGGIVTNGGGAVLTASGVVWSSSPNPTIASQPGGGITNDNTAVGTYVSTLTGLVNGTTYYVKAYATNIYGTGYGAEIAFTANSNLPVVATNPIPVGGLAGSIAVGSGTINGEGSTAVTTYGLCWGTSSNPSITTNLGLTTNAFPITVPFTFNDVITV